MQKAGAASPYKRNLSRVVLATDIVFRPAKILHTEPVASYFLYDGIRVDV